MTDDLNEVFELADRFRRTMINRGLTSARTKCPHNHAISSKFIVGEIRDGRFKMACENSLCAYRYEEN